MKPTQRTRTALLAGTAVLALGASACSSAADLPREDGTRGIDARGYLLDYDQGSGDYAVSAAPSVEESGSAAPGQPTPQPPGLLDDNTFVDAGTSGFVPTAQDPLSTFALDVDTGSYSLARGLLIEGQAPPPESIRVEEWVNSFDYDDPAPDTGDLGLSVEQGEVAGEPDTRLVRVGIAAREVADADRPPVNLTLVVDTSGSMDIRERLGLVKSSVALLADTLDDDDTLAIVTYESTARPVLEPTPVSQTDTILRAIDRLRPGGSTNLAAGLRLAYEQAESAYVEGAINTVVLASDGVANTGETDVDVLADEIQQRAQDDLHLVTVGFGMGNYNDDLMEQLSNRGDGFYAYVDTFEEAEQLFVEDLTETLTVVARDARVQLDLDPALVDSYRLVGYDNRAIADDDFDDLSVDAGEVGAGHTVSALYELRLTDAGEAASDPLGTVDLRWVSAETDAPAETTASIDLADAATGDDSVVLAAAVADTAQLLKGVGLLDQRGVTLEQVRERIDGLDGDGAEELDALIGAALGAR